VDKPLVAHTHTHTNPNRYPDVAAFMDGVPLCIDGRCSDSICGGTSASTPTVAGVISLVNDVRLNKGLPPLGFVVPRLWDVAERCGRAAHHLYFHVDLQRRHDAYCCCCCSPLPPHTHTHTHTHTHIHTHTHTHTTALVAGSLVRPSPTLQRSPTLPQGVSRTFPPPKVGIHRQGGATLTGLALSSTLDPMTRSRLSDECRLCSHFDKNTCNTCNKKANKQTN
jgi:hypothetical protein